MKRQRHITEKTTLTYGVYVRKSTTDEDRQMLSLGDQTKELRSLVAQERLNVGVWYPGESRTAHKRGRPIFASLLNDIHNGTINALLVWHTNRIARNVVEGALVIEAMDNGLLLEVRTPQRVYRNNGTDKKNLMDDFVEAKKSSDDNSEGVLRGLQSKRDMGWMPGVAPQGYMNTKYAERGSNTIVVDEDRFRLLRRAWDHLLTGQYGVPEILVMLNEWGYRTRPTKTRGGRPMSRASIYRIFTDPFYCGLPERNGVVYEGKHKPMVSVEEFDKVQFILGKYGRRRMTPHAYAYSGLIRCGECGGPISATFKQKILRSGEVRDYTLYYCSRARKSPKTCSQGNYTNVNNVEDVIRDELISITIHPAFRDWAIEILRREYAQELNEQQARIEHQQKEMSMAKQQLNNLVDLRLTGRIDDTMYDLKKQDLENQVTRLEVALQQVGGISEHWIERAERVFDLACNARSLFATGDVGVRRTILSNIGLNWTLKDRIFSIEAAPWLMPIKKSQSTVLRKIEAFEPEKTQWSKRQKEAFASLSPLMRGRRDLNSQPPA